MATVINSRRAFVGTMLAGAAAAGSVAFLLRGRIAPPSAGIIVEPGTTAADVALASAGTVPGEMAIWAKSIGQNFMATGADDTGGLTLTAVSPAPAGGARPAALRQQPFWASFSFPASGAPKGGAIYDIDHPIAGLSRLFMTRAPDHAGRALLMALFN